MDSESSVLFQYDSEPWTSRSLVAKLADIAAAGAIEDDDYSLGGTVEALEARAAGMLGKEASVFMPTGTLANHLAVRRLCGPRQRVVVQEQSHLYHDSGDGVTKLSGLSLVPLAKGRPYFTLAELEEAVHQSQTGRVATPIGTVVIESPVRRQAGQVMPFIEMERITSYCREQGIRCHLDGARLYMMSAATGTRPEEYSALFDTVYISLYKYFGAPFGGILAGSKELIADLFHDRRMFGGGLSSTALSAALALQGMDGFEERFVQSMAKARELFERLNGIEGIAVEAFEHGSNIFKLSIAEHIDVEALALALREHWIFISSDKTERGALLLTVNTTILRQPNERLAEAFRDAVEGLGS